MPGWAPDDFNLKDHSVFRYGDAYYLVSNYLTDTHLEDRLAYARSTDLCTWEDLGPILTERQAGSWDAYALWGPFVWSENGTFYLFYTGVGGNVVQSIMLATTTDPANPGAWQPQGMIFQPQHPDMVWPGVGQWSDNRDPMLVKAHNRYYLYYTGLDHDGGIIGVATADALGGPWHDWGTLLTNPHGMLESASVWEHDGYYYLAYSPTAPGSVPEVRVGPTPVGPWSRPRPLSRGWAHEFWRRSDGTWMTSYVATTYRGLYNVVVEPMVWDETEVPAWPWVGNELWHVWLPTITNT